MARIWNRLIIVTGLALALTEMTLSVSEDEFRLNSLILRASRAKKPGQKCIKEDKLCNCNCCDGLYCLRAKQTPSGSRPRICMKLGLGQMPPSECKPATPPPEQTQQDSEALGPQSIPVVGGMAPSGGGAGGETGSSDGSTAPGVDSIPVVGEGIQQGADTASQQAAAAQATTTTVGTTGKPARPSKKPNKPPQKPAKPGKNPPTSQSQSQPSQGNIPSGPSMPSGGIPSQPASPAAAVPNPVNGGTGASGAGASGFPNPPYVPSARNGKIHDSE